jgi:class 3 adenylate cyclase/CHASE2 domain-containing sensor protein
VLVDLGDDPSVYEADRVCPQPPNGCEIPRMVYAKAARMLRHWGAKAVVFDLMFSRPCPFEDGEVAKAFHEAGNVIVAATTKVIPGATSLEPPVDPIGKAVWAVGSPVAHQPNETVRSIPLVVSDRDTGEPYAALSLLAFQCFKGVKPGDVKLTAGQRLVAAGVTVPLVTGEHISALPEGRPGSEENSAGAAAAFEVVKGDNAHDVTGQKAWNAVLVNWSGPRGTIDPLPMKDVLAMGDRAGRLRFAGKVVLIGRCGWDQHWTAVGSMPGPEIQANALDTLISGKYIRPQSPWVFLALVLLLGTTTSFVVRRTKMVRAAFGVALLMVLVVAAARELLFREGVWLYVFYAEASILLSWGITSSAQSGRVAGLLRRLLPGFVADTGAREVRDATIVYSDIRNYTTISEQVGAEPMLNLLTPYRSAMESIVKKHGGDIGITPGDAILAVFWREFRKANHATCAVRAAREMLEAIPSLGKAWEGAGAALRVGIGVNVGPVATGTVGDQRVEGTVIGDAVNVAQRLETLTKDLGYPLLLSEGVVVRLKEDVGAIYLDEVTVTGRQEPIKVHGLVGPEPADAKPRDGADAASKEKGNEG